MKFEKSSEWRSRCTLSNKLEANQIESIDTTSNFYFLKKSWPNLADLGFAAEKYLYIDPNTTFIKLRKFCELVVDYILENRPIFDINENNTSFSYKLKTIIKHGILPDHIIRAFNSIKEFGNAAAHGNLDSKEKAIDILRSAYSISVWLQKRFENEFIIPPLFSIPTNDRSFSKEEAYILLYERDNYKKEFEYLKKEVELYRNFKNPKMCDAFILIFNEIKGIYEDLLHENKNVNFHQSFECLGFDVITKSTKLFFGFSLTLWQHTKNLPVFFQIKPGWITNPEIRSGILTSYIYQKDKKFGYIRAFEVDEIEKWKSTIKTLVNHFDSI